LSERISSARLLRPADPYLPYWDHPYEGAMLLEDGSLMAMARLRGQPHELCVASERNAAAQLLCLASPRPMNVPLSSSSVRRDGGCEGSLAKRGGVRGLS